MLSVTKWCHVSCPLLRCHFCNASFFCNLCAGSSQDQLYLLSPDVCFVSSALDAVFFVFSFPPTRLHPLHDFSVTSTSFSSSYIFFVQSRLEHSFACHLWTRKDKNGPSSLNMQIKAYDAPLAYVIHYEFEQIIVLLFEAIRAHREIIYYQIDFDCEPYIGSSFASTSGLLLAPLSLRPNCAIIYFYYFYLLFLYF